MPINCGISQSSGCSMLTDPVAMKIHELAVEGFGSDRIIIAHALYIRRVGKNVR